VNVIGWIVAVLLFTGIVITWLANYVNSIAILKSNIVTPLVKYLRFKRLEKSAIKSDIEGHVNKTIRQIRRELPPGWLDPLSIQWVREETAAAFISDDKIVMRVAPLEREQSNFVNALYIYLRTALFPRSRSVLEETHFESAVLQFARRIVDEQDHDLLVAFEAEVLEPAVGRRQKVVEYLERLDKLDSRGLLTGMFIREIDSSARAIQFKKVRSNFGSEFVEVLSHLETFLGGLGQEDPVPEALWARSGVGGTYGLLLVAHPEKAAGDLVKGYVNRARDRAQTGVNRLYVFGGANQSPFVDKVIAAIGASVEGYTCVEEFALHRDYRGSVGGKGALFELQRASATSKESHSLSASDQAIDVPADKESPTLDNPET
jgi:hypothetical protein